MTTEKGIFSDKMQRGLKQESNWSLLLGLKCDLDPEL